MLTNIYKEYNCIYKSWGMNSAKWIRWFENEQVLSDWKFASESKTTGQEYHNGDKSFKNARTPVNACEGLFHTNSLRFLDSKY